MHPEIMRALARARVADLHRRAALARQARAGRPDRRWRRHGSRVAAVIAECWRAQRRAVIVGNSVDRRLPRPDLPPEHYREFLARTAGPLLREPSAAARSHGQAVR